MIRTLIILIILIIGGFLVYIYTGSYNIAATEPHSEIAEWVFETTKKYSVRRHSEGIATPPLNDQSLINTGFDHYEDMCAGCHGAPGRSPAKGFNPSPPELAEEADEFSAAELFWIVKHGLKMTGMPAFGPAHSDEEIWAIVAFLKRLPELTPEEYKAMEARSIGTEHEHTY